ncbi:hypothetical protein L211DRAFT_837309 [Terfezia boudieri ATCC MYA-4762]|uniref:Uncharacterized protein n=1 Tax=Terfezia boudieri ATCC MYA-4762 TaxID=1051890 RepID=A0A3N4LW84_9PEZI|nr:hypothetical protein L211DRAFT_837309 [Terfezia boudieri ATCC MYA-4762]
MKFTVFPSTMPIYMIFFSMLGMLYVVTAVAIPNAAPAAIDGTGFTPVQERNPITNRRVRKICGEQCRRTSDCSILCFCSNEVTRQYFGNCVSNQK